MQIAEIIDKIASRENIGKEDLIKNGIVAFLVEKKRKYLQDRFEILSKYRVSTVEELKKSIEDGKINEHPAWEELIEVKNIEAEVKEIEDDIRNLQKT